MKPMSGLLNCCGQRLGINEPILWQQAGLGGQINDCSSGGTDAQHPSRTFGQNGGQFGQVQVFVVSANDTDK